MGNYELPTCTTDLVTENKIISGDSVTLTCSLTGAAPPGELVWMKNNTVVLNGSQPLVWTTQITKENQNDIYNCKYHHHTLSPSPTCADDIQFDVQYPPVIALDIAEGTHEVKIGDEFSAACTVIDANPPASVVWTNKSMEVGSGDMPDSVEISHAHGGKAIENHTLTCTCSADANPTASYTWLDQAQNQIADRATLTLENVQRSNSGIFTCEASNLFGIVSASINIDVQYPPIASVFISSGDRAGTIREGEYFSAACVAVDGNPPPTVEWIKDGVLVAAGSSLSLLNINKLYSGVYKCTATSTYYNNYTSTDEKVITLDVQYPPGPPYVHYFNDGKVVEGTTFNATCTGRNGNPSSYTYQWRHGGQLLTDQQILTVENIQRDQSGLYTCISTNDMYDMIGSATGTIAIDVQYLPTKVGDTRYFAEIGHSVVIKLTVDANPLPVTFGEWKLGHVALNKTDSSNTSSVTITDVEPEHFGNYSLSAENAVGVATIIVSLEPTGPPGAPTLQLLSQDYTNLTLLINPGHSGGDEGGVVYTLEYRLFGFGPFNPWQSSTTSVVIVVFDLQSGSVYEFQAYAENSFGKSDISDTYKFNTYGLPNITLNLDTGTLSWTPHDNENYYCVKIEKKSTDKDAEWEIIEECIPQHIMEFTMQRKAEAASPYEVLNPKMISESVYMKCGETSFEYPRDRLSTRSVLHDGNRHRIVLCKAWHIGGKEGASEVAVKMATGNTNLLNRIY
ncbi:protein turtle homolog B-like [Ptychodera flava]|uniref:protein turtle homolog B-like n=1 Tax=Ptychodera flava TaxID=63121 RepID=UPI003969D51B